MLAVRLKVIVLGEKTFVLSLWQDNTPGDVGG